MLNLDAIKARLAQQEQMPVNLWSSPFVDHAPGDIRALLDEVARLQALVGELLTYAEHSTTCNIGYSPCSCGLNGLLAEQDN